MKNLRRPAEPRQQTCRTTDKENQVRWMNMYLDFVLNVNVSVYSLHHLRSKTQDETEQNQMYMTLILKNMRKACYYLRKSKKR